MESATHNTIIQPIRYVRSRGVGVGGQFLPAYQISAGYGVERIKKNKPFNQSDMSEVGGAAPARVMRSCCSPPECMMFLTFLTFRLSLFFYRIYFYYFFSRAYKLKIS